MNRQCKAVNCINNSISPHSGEHEREDRVKVKPLMQDDKPLFACETLSARKLVDLRSCPILPSPYLYSPPC